MTKNSFEDYVTRLDKSMGEGVVHYMNEEPDPPENTFEIALVMAGAISAGCYSAGVLDFLIEALDAWEAEKAKEGTEVPRHQVKIRVFAGASAGSMTAAIAAAALRYEFPHIRASSVIKQGVYTNPFYESWVRRIDASVLLNDSDLQANPNTLYSLLDGTALEEICRDALDGGSTLADKARPYIADRIRFIFTQCGLAGTPYFFSLPGAANEGMAMRIHKTYRSFSVRYGNTATLRRPDDVQLDANVRIKSRNHGWMTLGRAALSSGAFPVALPSWRDSRPATDLFYRFVVVPGDQRAQLQVKRIIPSWFHLSNGELPVSLNTVNDQIIDGGVMNNEPFDLARAELAGLLGTNKRSGEQARRAIILIDPFPDVADNQQNVDALPVDMFSAAMGLINAWKQQSRFDPVDLALASDNAIYSRYLISPVRIADGATVAAGKMTIASGCLNGFGGFLSEEFRHHDYLLGRRNCQQFLRNHFSLPSSNTLFIHNGVFDVGNRQRTMNGEIPVIPLTRHLLLSEPLPALPVTPVDVSQLVDRVFERIKKVGNVGLRHYKPGFLKKSYIQLGEYFILKSLKEGLKNKIKNNLNEYGIRFK